MSRFLELDDVVRLVDVETVGVDVETGAPAPPNRILGARRVLLAVVHALIDEPIVAVLTGKPCADPRDTTFDVEGDTIVARVGSRRAVLVGHPAGAGDVVLETAAAQAAWLRDRLFDGRLLELIDDIQAAASRGRNGLLLNVGDACVTQFLETGVELDCMERAVVCAQAFVPGTPRIATRPIAKVGWYAGRERVIRTRSGCCLWRRTPGHGECEDCPLITDEERARVWDEYAIVPPIAIAAIMALLGPPADG